MFGCCKSQSKKRQKNIKLNGNEAVTKANGKELPPRLPKPRAATPPPGPRYIALYDYCAINDGDLSFQKGEELFILDWDGDWWSAQSAKTRARGFVPNNYVAPVGGLDSQDWFFGDLPRIESERLLKRHDLTRGTFLIRTSSSSPGSFSLSVLDDTWVKGREVKHYRIYQDEAESVFINAKKVFENLFDLVAFYKSSQDGLCCTLAEACPRHQDFAPVSFDRFTTDRGTIALVKKIGAGNFGEVWKGLWKNSFDVAVKTLKPGTMSTTAFLEEAKTMKDLCHEKLIRLYAVVPYEPIFIITEYMTYGNLLSYLKAGKGRSTQIMDHVDMAAQIAAGMSFLEQRDYVHRDLRAANILVGDYQVCKIGDFGLARLLTDGVYKTKNGSVAPIKWTAPEALAYEEFSTKSDVWSFGILFTEILTRGRTPYPAIANCDILKQIENGYRMPIPNLPPPNPPCPQQLYELMLQCWEINKERRPTFEEMQIFLEDYFVGPEHRYEPSTDENGW